MALFGIGTSSSSNKTTNNYAVDNSYSDSSRNYLDQSDHSVSVDNSVTTITDGGAIEGNRQVSLAAINQSQGAIDAMAGFGGDALGFGEKALDTAGGATQSAINVAGNSLNFGESVLDSAFDHSEANINRAMSAVTDTTRLSHQLTRDTVDRSLAIASERSATQSENVMSGVVKIAMGVAVVVGIGFVATAWGRK